MLRFKTAEELVRDKIDIAHYFPTPHDRYYGKIVVNKTHVRQYHNRIKAYQLDSNWNDQNGNLREDLYAFTIYRGNNNYYNVYLNCLVEILSPEEVAQEVLDYIKQVPSIKRLRELFEEA